MSEEILRALMQLFAILTKQDGGVEESEERYVWNFLKSQLGETGTEEYFELFREEAGLNQESPQNAKKLTSVLDSVRILGLCKKINKTLNQSQKTVVMIRLFELIASEKKLTSQRHAIIETAAKVFKIDNQVYASIGDYVLNRAERSPAGKENIIQLSTKKDSNSGKKGISPVEKGDLHFLRIPDIDLYFIRYYGRDDLYLNGLGLHKKRIYIFSKGSTVRLPHGKPIYYSDVASYFMDVKTDNELFFEAEKVNYKFKNGNYGLRDISFTAKHGYLLGILGSSGTGKTTLLNVLSGVMIPSSGSVRLNGFDIRSEEIQGAIGYIPQDDLLIEELTVFQNLYYNTRLCFKELKDEEIKEKVDSTLDRLGLTAQKDLQVGSPFNKTISGGQRKRLNIALELIREPSVLFVDEPTSGLSSRDSENVMDLLRELALMGKLIFVVIHQPSSEIFKMFDNTIIMDEGGYMVYYGNPVEAVMYFKLLDNQINSQMGECPVCGNVNPELIFNILEARVVDEYGNYTKQRKISPAQWHEYYKTSAEKEEAPDDFDKPPRNLNIPGWFKQLRVFIERDVLSKIGNRQYILLTMLEAPVLGFILSYIIRYIADPSSDTYIFRENENIPIYIFMAMIVAVFLGLTVSAEEIFRDRKILKRERFLQLSRSGYLTSKIVILFAISAIQGLLFVGVANTLIEIRHMYFEYWFAFFTTAAFANMLGLNISSAFNSAVTIYIVIPLLIIPMMVLSGAMFSFEKLNRNISRIDKVPFLAEIMPTRWSYEALMVNQFRNNYFQVNFYELDKEITNADFKISWHIPELESRLIDVKAELQVKGEIKENKDNLLVLKNELLKEDQQTEGIDIPGESFFDPATMTMEKIDRIENILDELNIHYLEVFSRENQHKNNKVKNLLKNLEDTYYRYLNDYHNERLADEVRKIYEKKKIVEFEHGLVRMIDPVYQDPNPSHPLDFRTHFFAPRKHFLGKFHETYTFNMIMIWVLTGFLYVALYYDWLGRVVRRGGVSGER